MRIVFSAVCQAQDGGEAPFELCAPSHCISSSVQYIFK